VAEKQGSTADSRLSAKRGALLPKHLKRQFHRINLLGDRFFLDLYGL
jgi:hypothetical protein